eukprot:9207006-Pyramimonas_sp.AAC.1
MAEAYLQVPGQPHRLPHQLRVVPELEGGVPARALPQSGHGRIRVERGDGALVVVHALEHRPRERNEERREISIGRNETESKSSDLKPETGECVFRSSKGRRQMSEKGAEFARNDGVESNVRGVA